MQFNIDRARAQVSLCYLFLFLFLFFHSFVPRFRGPARVNSDKRHGPKSNDSALNEIATRDNLPRPNCDSDGKADNKRQAFINTDTRRFR